MHTVMVRVRVRFKRNPSGCDSLAMEDPLVAPVDDTFVAPEARRRAESAPANAAREL